jgi:hypothetical protein
VVPQDDLGAPASPSRTRSADPKVVGEALANDACTTTPPRGAVESRATSPPVVDSRVETPLRAIEAVGVFAGDVGATTSPRVIDVDPISARPVEAEDLIKDQPQIDQAPGGPGTSGAQVPNLRRQARGCRGGRLTEITPHGRMTFSRTMKICRPCGPAL